MNNFDFYKSNRIREMWAADQCQRNLTVCYDNFEMVFIAGLA